MSKKYNTIIWDWNGTLIDDAWLAIEVINDMLSKRKMKSIDIDYYRQIFDFPVKNYYAKIGFNFSKESFEIVGNEFIKQYDLRHFECKLRTNAVECINKLNKAGINQFVLSARNQKQLNKEMEYFNIHNQFKTFLGLPDNYAHSKMELGQQLIKNENIMNESTVMIGDTTHDYEVARELGIDCILVEGGHHSEKRLKECGVKVLKDLEDLVMIDL